MASHSMMFRMIRRISEPRILVLLMGVALLVGLWTFQDFGISWDEPNMYYLGEEAYEYVFGDGPYVQLRGRRFHGPIIEVSFSILQRIFGFTTSREIFLMRHLGTYLFFMAGIPLFYFLCKRVTAQWRIALLGALFLFLSPRMFGHAFINSRDIPNLVLFTAAMLTLLRLLERPTPLRAVIHGVLSGLTMMRMTGLFLPMITLPMLATNLIADRSRGNLRQLAHIGAIYLCAFVPATFLFWPLLWETPWKHFWDTYEFMGTLGGGNFFLGEWRSFPILYFPVWIAVTTPIVYLLLFGVGIVRACREAAEGLLSFLQRRQIIVVAALWVFLPLATVMVKHLGVYDDWRHIYFIYPAILLLAVYGCDWLLLSSRQIIRTVTAAAVSVSCLWTAVWMVRNHPHQIVYFSVPGSWVDGTMELDYWGLTYRRAFEFILERDSTPVIPIHPTGSPGYSTPFVMPEDQVRRITLVDEPEAKYVLDNFRRDQYAKKYPADKKIHSIMVGGVEALGIYTMK